MAAVEPTIHVSGCSNETVSNIIQGVYNTKESNHGKPVYRKEGPPGSVTVLIYFWDSRDGAAFNGWWFGPKVGGDQVWAYNGNLGRPDVMPPPNNWKVPWDGKIDDKLRITVSDRPPSRRDDPHAQSHDRRRDDRQREEQRMREEQRQREERRRREEEERRREAERRRREEEQRREAERRKREEERKQEAAADNVRKVLAKLRNATPDNLKDLQGELDRAAASNFQAMGLLRDRVNDEMQNTLTQVQKRVAEELKQREEAERRRQVELARVEQLVKDAAIEVDAAEARVAEASASAKAGADLAAPVELLEAVLAASKEVEAARAMLEKSSAVLAAKKEEMGAGEGARHVKKEVEELQARINASSRALSKCSESLEEYRAKGLRRAAAEKQDQAWKACFSKHDSDQDGQLSRAEVLSFGLAEFQIDLVPEVVDHIMRVLEPINFEKFLPLRQKVGIAKFEAEHRQRLEKEEEQKRLAEQKRAEVQQVTEEVSASLEEAKRTLELSPEDAQAEEKVQEVRAALGSSLQRLQELADFPEQRLRREVGRLVEQHRQLETQTEQVLGQVKAARDAFKEKVQKEAQQLRARAVASIRSHMTTTKKSGEELFESFGADSVEKESFCDFVKGLEDMALETEQMDRLWAEIAADGLQKSEFLELIRLYYKCVKGTVLSEDISIKSKTVRRLEVDEILEVLEGPLKEDGANVRRVRCRAQSDKATGWATIAGNQGTPFLVQVEIDRKQEEKQEENQEEKHEEKHEEKQEEKKEEKKEEVEAKEENNDIKEES
ncbi:unnamed protein product [Effrenium voratum]|nr:unnamed protein product [Effrenium voratum]